MVNERVRAAAASSSIGAFCGAASARAGSPDTSCGSGSRSARNDDCPVPLPGGRFSRLLVVNSDHPYMLVPRHEQAQASPK